MATTIPCKRPKVTAEPADNGLVTHTCHVPGCDWTFTSVKSAEEPKWHRDEHRRAVPTIELRKHTTGYTIHCSDHGQLLESGDARNTVHRQRADEKASYHLSADHGLVSC